MNYQDFLAAGYPIASGVIEGACRTVIKDRTERAGMRWVFEGADAMMGLRSIHLSELWDEFHEYRIEKNWDAYIRKPPQMTILGQCLWWLRRRGRRVALIAKFLTSVEARRTTRKKFGQSLRKFGNWARQARHVLRKGEMLRQARGRLAGHLVQVGHGLVRKVLVHYEADVYHSGVNVGLELPDVASLKAAP